MTLPRTLYITYDGLLDPLGSSQILPYLIGLSSLGQNIHILSFEKPDRYLHSSTSLRQLLDTSSIAWTPLIFTRDLGVLGKGWDLFRMYLVSFLISLRYRPSIVHARGHAPALPALLLKYLFSARFLFDCRGLFFDERVDKGSWDLSNPWHRVQYRFFKTVEHSLFALADHVVVLTQRFIPEALRIGCTSVSKITVIPCCADFTHFKLVTHNSSHLARQEFNIPASSLVLGYLGSVGKMYMPDSFLQLVKLALDKQIDLYALALTPDYDQFNQLVTRNLSPDYHSRIHIVSASREQVPFWMSAVDILVSFIQPSYARTASSPTKLAEAWSMGIPCVCNQGVGDLSELVPALDAGIVIESPTIDAFHHVIDSFPDLLSKKGKRLRQASFKKLSLELAVNRYHNIYTDLRP